MLWRQVFAIGFPSGFVLRGISARLPLTDASPINAATRSPYTDAEWARATSSLLAEIRRAAPRASISFETNDAGSTLGAESGAIPVVSPDTH